MSNVGDIVAKLIDAGCPPDLAAEVVAEAFAAGAASASFRVEERLSPGAIRTRRWRAKASQSVTKPSPSDADANVTEASPNVTDRHGDVTGDNVHIYKKKEEEPSKEESKKKKKASLRGSRLGDAWQPSDADRQFARSQGMTEADIDGQSPRFIDYWRSRPGQGGVKADWPATWRNWCRSFCEKAGRAPIEPTATGPPTPIGWKPGMPTDEELRARHARPKPNGTDHREELPQAGGELHRGDAEGRSQEPPDH